MPGGIHFRGDQETAFLTHLLGDRLICVRQHGDAASPVRTAEIVLDREVLAALEAGFANGNGRARRRAASVAAAPRAVAPCACGGLLGTDLGPQLTFAFTALPQSHVLATVDELPTIWATGDSESAARTALVIEVMLLLALNPAGARPPVDPKRLLKREAFTLPTMRRRA
jgi:hypothetical protein